MDAEMVGYGSNSPPLLPFSYLQANRTAAMVLCHSGVSKPTSAQQEWKDMWKSSSVPYIVFLMRVRTVDNELLPLAYRNCPHQIVLSSVFMVPSVLVIRAGRAKPAMTAGKRAALP
jgi:hypothetical protein